MLKVEPRFRLDRPYTRPFRIQSLTTTNAVIMSMDNCNGEPINISRQRLSKASPLVEAGKPWLGYSGILRHRHQICRTVSAQKVTNSVIGTTPPPDGTPTSVEQQTLPEQDSEVITKHGRRVRKPARLMLVADHMVKQSKEGEVVESRESQRQLKQNCMVARLN